MLEKIYILKKICSYELPIHQKILGKNKQFPQKSCDTQD